ncbi:hypothetical protein VEE20_44250 (plasmid) [Escherichia coli]|nr:hypothetical protein VEE20_44250 [Escherichia coli]
MYKNTLCIRAAGEELSRDFAFTRRLTKKTQTLTRFYNNNKKLISCKSYTLNVSFGLTYSVDIIAHDDMINLKLNSHILSKK